MEWCVDGCMFKGGCLSRQPVRIVVNQGLMKVVPVRSPVRRRQWTRQVEGGMEWRSVGANGLLDWREGFSRFSFRGRDRILPAGRGGPRLEGTRLSHCPEPASRDWSR